MNGLFEAALEIQQFLGDRNWRFCIIGGLAVVRWGQPRATQDVDVSLLTGFGSEAFYVDAILQTFAGRLADARAFAIANRVVLAKASNGVPLDIALAAVPFEEQVIVRATAFDFSPGVRLVTASAEDLVVLKSFAGRDRDWGDVEGILVRQTSRLDWDYIRTELELLCELQESAEPLAHLEQLRRRIGT